jgi:hypothetical protein
VAVLILVLRHIRLVPVELPDKATLAEQSLTTVIMVTRQAVVEALERLGRQGFRAVRVESEFLHQSLVQQW